MIVLPLALFSVLVAVLYIKQDSIVQEIIESANADFQGHFTLGGSHISPFVNFPYISIDLEQLALFEGKRHDEAAVLEADDLYIGIDVFTLIRGNFEVKRIKAEGLRIHMHQYADGTYNIANALAPTEPDLEPGEDLHLNLKSVVAKNLQITKYSEESGLFIQGDVSELNTRYASYEGGMEVGLDSDFYLTVVQSGDTSFVENKHIRISTAFDFDNASQVVQFQPSEVGLGNAVFTMNGSIDIDDNAKLDLDFEGQKKDFELLMAFAPDDLIPTLQKYENAGDIFFRATIEGESINGYAPYFYAEFGCEDGFFNNSGNDKRLDEMQFRGYFTNGAKRTTETMAFGLERFSARPEAGIFSGALEVINFDSPDINLQIDSDFNLDFLAQFLNVEQLQDLRGHVLLKMNFHDIIDLSQPEKSIEKLNESYFTELHVTDLGFRSPDFHLPIEDIDIRASMDGHAATIEHFRFKAGATDFELSGTVDDLPAILHHTSIPVESRLKVRSKRIDLVELSSAGTDSSSFDEVLEDLELDLTFKASARAFTESKNLPVGEFFIDRLNVSLKNYPHRLHDFRADLFIEEEDFSIIDFSGIIDESDFHFSGRLSHYDLWFDEVPRGDTYIDFDLNSDLLRLEDLFTYGGENYLPEDYRHEEFQDLKLHGSTALHFQDSLQSFDFELQRLSAGMKMHPLRLEKFSGRAHLEEGVLELHSFGGEMGDSDLRLSGTLHLRESAQQSLLRISSQRLDLDKLLAWEPPGEAEVVDHDAVFSIFDIPFPNMGVELALGEVTYHKYRLSNIHGKLRTTQSHQLYCEPLHLELAGGSMDLEARFNGARRDSIYLIPKLQFSDLDLDQLMVKFDNFGQDAIVAENLHGRISGALDGVIHLHADLVPIIDDSDIHIDLEVVNGRLDDYEPMQALADYFQDKNLNRVAFDTLSNHIDLVNGQLSIPNMRIHSTLGYLELSGQQDMDLNMDYLIRVPWKMVTSAGTQRLFGSRNKADVEGDDEIIQSDPSRRTRFVNVRMTGTPDDFRVSLAGKRRVLEGG